MSFKDRLKEARLKKQLTQEQLSKQIGIAKSTLAGYEGGNREPSMLTVSKIMDILEVDANFLWQDEMGDNFREKVSYDEMVFIEKYRSVDDFGRETVNYILDREVERTKQKEKYILSLQSADTEETVDLPLFYLPASAGTGAFLDSDDYELYRFPSRKVPFGTTFALRVRGNSMEPVFYDGDIVFVKQQPTLENGQIGIFILNGEGFIKKFSQDEHGYTLISKNPEYDDIFIGENDDIRIVGRVLRKYSS